jgi:hypothetical protein
MGELVGVNKLQRMLAIVLENEIATISDRNDVDMIVAADMFLAEVLGETKYADYSDEKKEEYKKIIEQLKELIK